MVENTHWNKFIADRQRRRHLTKVVESISLINFYLGQINFTGRLIPVLVLLFPTEKVLLLVLDDSSTTNSLNFLSVGDEKIRRSVSSSLPTLLTDLGP